MHDVMHSSASDHSCPQGFSIKVKLLDTWGDLYYIGLSSIQVFNSRAEEIVTPATRVTASPHSDITHLPGMQQD